MNTTMTPPFAPPRSPSIDELHERLSGGNVDCASAALQITTTLPSAGYALQEYAPNDAGEPARVGPQYKVPAPLQARFLEALRCEQGNGLRAYAEATGEFPRALDVAGGTPELEHHWLPDEIGRFLATPRVTVANLVAWRPMHQRAVVQALVAGRYVPPQVLAARGMQPAVDEAVRLVAWRLRQALSPHAPDARHALECRRIRLALALGHEQPVHVYRRRVAQLLAQALHAGAPEVGGAPWGEAQGLALRLRRDAPRQLVIGPAGAAGEPVELHRVDLRIHDSSVGQGDSLSELLRIEHGIDAARLHDGMMMLVRAPAQGQAAGAAEVQRPRMR